MVIGGDDKGGMSGCVPHPKKNSEIEEQSLGSVVLEYSHDGGISWNFIHELIPSLYRTPRLDDGYI